MKKLLIAQVGWVSSSQNLKNDGELESQSSPNVLCTIDGMRTKNRGGLPKAHTRLCSLFPKCGKNVIGVFYNFGLIAYILSRGDTSRDNLLKRALKLVLPIGFAYLIYKSSCVGPHFSISVIH